MAFLSHSTHRWTSLAKTTLNEDEFKPMLEELEYTAQQITSLLFVLSTSIEHALPLPPYLLKFARPQLCEIWENIKQRPHKSHLGEPVIVGFLFCMMQTIINVIIDDIEGLTEDVKGLVGYVDFSTEVGRMSGGVAMDGVMGG